MTLRQSLSDEQKDKLKQLLNALQPFLKTRPTMPMQYVVAYLLAALHEGSGVTELAERAGVSQSVMSRHLLDIGDRNRHKEDGFGWVTQRPDPMELRKHQVTLTEKGRTIAAQVSRAIRG
jgi:DNA-binding MarR family transcriptional regulator